MLHSQYLAIFAFIGVCNAFRRLNSHPSRSVAHSTVSLALYQSLSSASLLNLILFTLVHFTSKFDLSGHSFAEVDNTSLHNFRTYNTYNKIC